MKLNNFCRLIEWTGLVFCFICMIGHDAGGGAVGLLLAIFAHLKREPESE